MHDDTTVRLPAESVAVIEDRIRDTEFESVSAYLTFLIEELSYQDKCADTCRPHSRTDSRTDKISTAGRQGTTLDDNTIEQRLRSLGYLSE